MRKTFLIVVVALLLMQGAAMLLLWGSPGQQLQRSYTPTPEPRLPTATLAPTRTPVPIPAQATLPARSGAAQPMELVSGECRVEALDLISAWVHADKPETDPFEFASLEGQTCTATFSEDVLPLFTRSNVWYAGAIACSACHNADLAASSAQMDLSSYRGILAGSRRANENAKGTDILSSGAGWEQSKLHQMIFTRAMPMGRPSTSPPKGPVVYAGIIKS